MTEHTSEVKGLHMRGGGTRAWKEEDSRFIVGYAVKGGRGLRSPTDLSLELCLLGDLTLHSFILPLTYSVVTCRVFLSVSLFAERNVWNWGPR